MCDVVGGGLVYTLLFGVFAAAALFGWSSNPVHGVLTLVGVGLGAAGGLLVHGMEFTAFVVVLVYVGAVTILFIFVVMMVNLRATLHAYTLVEAPVVWVVLAGWITPVVGATRVAPPGEHPDSLTAMGTLLWGSDLVVVTTVAAGVLFVAMVAAICLSLVTAENYRTQEFYTQIRRNNSLFGFTPRV